MENKQKMLFTKKVIIDKTHYNIIAYIKDKNNEREIVCIPFKNNKYIYNSNDEKKYIDNLKILGYDLWKAREILESIKQNFDISYYYDRNLTWKQMEQIRLGQEQGLDVSTYAKTKYSYLQMLEMRYALENGVDFSPYVDEKYDYEETLEIVNYLKKDLPLPEHLKTSIYSRNKIIDQRVYQNYLKENKKRKEKIMNNNYDACYKCKNNNLEKVCPRCFMCNDCLNEISDSIDKYKKAEYFELCEFCFYDFID